MQVFHLGSAADGSKGKISLAGGNDRLCGLLHITECELVQNVPRLLADLLPWR